MAKKKKQILFDKNAPIIVLIKPQKADNIGSVARAMANFGIDKLRLIQPKCKWPDNQDAYTLASGADEIIDNAKVYQDLISAIKDCHFVYATTARPRDMVKNIASPAQIGKSINQNSKQNSISAILFGCESKGLSNEDLKYVHHICMIPVNNSFASLNLAQAVLLIAYEWYITKPITTYGGKTDEGVINETGLQMPHSQPASAQKLENFLDTLEKNIENGRFFKEKTRKQIMKRKIRNFILRTNPTEQEIGILFGIIAALKKSDRYFN